MNTWGCQACRMGIVGGMRKGGEGEEAIVEEGSLEEKVDQGVEEMPNEEDTEFGSC